jgi:hypothetical protein
VKDNIRDLNNSLDVVAQLRGVSYNFNEQSRVIDDVLKGREIYGFIAEELREVLPDLVYETDSAGALAVDYNGIIPVLVDAVQEQQKQIEQLKGLLKSAIAQSPTSVNSVELPQAILYQNNPNPWKETTEIRYELPEGATDAAIYISDLSGKLLKTLPATDSGVVTLKGADLKAGIYAYSLVVDGVIIDTKKMLLTK